MRERIDVADYSKRTPSMTVYNNNGGWDTYRKICFVDHLDTCQNFSAAMGIMYKDRLDKINEFRRANIRSSKSI